MAKPDESQNKPLNLNIFQDLDIDPMEILHEHEGKFAPTKAPVKAKKDETTDDDELDTQDDDTVDDDKDTKVKKAPEKKKAVTTIELSDEMIQGGLSKAKGFDVAKAKANSSTSDENDNENENEDKEGTKTDDKKNKTANLAGVYAAHYNAMVEADEWQAVDDFDGTEASYIKARDHNNELIREEALDEFLDDAFTKNPEGKIIGKKLLAHLANGGSVRSFQAVVAPQELNFEELDNDDDSIAEATANEILTSYYQSVGWKDAQIKSKLASLKKTGNAVEEAKLIQVPYTEQITAREQQQAQQLENNKKLNQKAQAVINTALNNMIDKGHAFGAIKVGVDKKDKEDYRQYIFIPQEETGRSEFSTELNANLRDPEFILYIATAMKHKLHKNPQATADGKKANSEAASSLEKTLQKSLLNKKLDDKGTKDPEVETEGTKSAASRHKWNLDEAVVLT